MRFSIQSLILLFIFLLHHLTWGVFAVDIRPELSDLLVEGSPEKPNFDSKAAWTRKLEYNLISALLAMSRSLGLPNSHILAIKVCEEMVISHKVWADTCGGNPGAEYRKAIQPLMVSAAVLDNTAYFGSIIKKNEPNILLQHENPALTIAMNQAREDFLRSGEVQGGPFELQGEFTHQRRAVCAEIMVISMILKNTGKLPKRPIEGDKKRSELHHGVLGEKGRVPRLWNPCIGNFVENLKSKLGREQVVLSQKMEAITEGTGDQPVDQAPTNYLSVPLRDTWKMVSAWGLANEIACLGGWG
ncbi:hypothetical protein P154DRAFT_564785 [Amniculicola lignicola CBS 123094]|uniref:Uncharacterized protein n=1 Tax=Amniculicola lignicola CBS 123094 TaxID=1392246 RepID=A0A6A5WC90_9PLEO|nr:hypothetical protein P154DRAFT_564785 [Amniculicola lignicola CBS 123094]